MKAIERTGPVFRSVGAVLLLALAVCNCMTLVKGLSMIHERSGTLAKPCDLKLRWNEMTCMHRGVNPFRIWNREIQDPEFHGLARRDLDGPDAVLDFDRSVNAYPPWHAVFFWWYGWLPYGHVVAVFFMLTGMALCGVLQFFLRHQPDGWSARALYWSALASLFLEHVMSLVVSGNYGGLIAGLLAMFLCAVRARRHVVAGLLWAVMMIKPQLVLLLFWPLLFQRRYVTIGVAAATCLAATFVPACLLHESPVELIRQIVVQGMPYVLSPEWWKPLDGLLGVSSNFVRMGVFSAVCAGIAWKMRNVKPEMFRYAAPFIVLPVAFYCPGYDLVVAWPAAFLALVWLCGLPARRLGLFLLCWMPCAVFKSAWWAARRFYGFNAAGLGWIYSAVDLASLLVCAAIFAGAVKALVRNGRAPATEQEVAA